MTDEASFSWVPQEHVSNIWGQVAPLLKRVTDLSDGRFEVSDLQDLILNKNYMLWIAFDDSAIIGATITMFQQYPRKKYLYMMFVGGVNIERWYSIGITTLRKFAGDTGCDGVEATGRLGWERVLKNDGYTSRWKVFDMPVIRSTEEEDSHHGV